MSAFSRPQTSGNLTTLSAAVARLVEPGSTVYLCAANGRPSAAVREICRQFTGRRAELTVASRGFVTPMHALVQLGIASRLITSFVGETYPFPRPSPVYARAVENGLEIEHWSLLSLVQRLEAAAEGAEWALARSLAGTTMAADLARNDLLREGPGAELAVRALVPDVAFVHAVEADPDGNAIVPAPRGEGIAAALAARRGAIVTAERIVPRSRLRRRAAEVQLPAAAVGAVCEVRFGSHPWGVYDGASGASYADDYGFLEGSARAAREERRLDEWLRRWVLEPNHEQYLNRLGRRRLVRLRRGRRRGRRRKAAFSGPASRQERLILAAAGLAAERVRDAGLTQILAGIGAANLAAWLAQRTLEECGVRVELIAEVGMYGYRPAPGDPFVFNLENVSSCVQTSDVSITLGRTILAGGRSTLGLLGAIEVDAAGNLNTTRTAAGAPLLGSGGACDVAASAAESLVCLPHDPARLVERVPYVTSPGAGVRTIVTDRAVLERGDDGAFALTRVVAPFEGGLHSAAEELAAALPLAPRVGGEVSVLELDPECLRPLRRYDPLRHFLGGEGRTSGEAERDG